MDFFEEDDEYDDERPRRRLGRMKVIRSIRSRISDAAKPKRRRSEEELDYDDEEDYGGYTSGSSSKKKKSKKKKNTKKTAATSGGTPILSRSSASRVLRSMSLSPSSSHSKAKEAEEQEDVPMPLPGDDTIASSNSKRSMNKKRNLVKIKNALVSNPTTRNSNSSASSSKGQKPGKTNSNKTRKKINRRGHRRKSHGSDQSTDSPPSVAYTENSVDVASRSGVSHQHAQLKIQAQQYQRLQKANNNTHAEKGIPRFFNRERDPDDENGLIRESMSMDYYYQSIPWIIKTWIYFLTVVVPFTLLYYCFVGIFHSSTLAQNPFLQKVAISNTLFAGLGCTFRSQFWARQTWDAKGVHSKGVVAPLLHSSMNRAKRTPRRNRSRSVSFNSKDTTNNGKLAFLRVPTTNLRLTKTRRLRTNSVTAPSSPSGFAKSSRILPNNNSILGSSSDRGIPSSARRPLCNQSAPPGNIRRGVWNDVETMLPKRNDASRKPSRAPLMKDKSIMEIYEVHASDEKVGIQFG